MRVLNLQRLTICTWLCLAAVCSANEPTKDAPARVSFVNDIIPVLTKSGCNAGTCHAKAPNGQNGFQLSLLGFEPQEDYEHLVKEGRGRRLFPASPENSLLVRKASGGIPHKGGARIEPTSSEYALLVNWIKQGAIYDGPNRSNISRHRSPTASRLDEAQ